MRRYLTTDETSLLDKRVHVTVTRRDGSEFPAELTVTRVRLQRRSIFCACLRDITKEQRAEQDLRAYAEGLRNVSRQLVEVQETERRVLAGLTIADDGCGFDPSACEQPAKDHGWGLMIMRERAAAVGADLCVESAPGCGTRVIVTLRDGATDDRRVGR